MSSVIARAGGPTGIARRLWAEPGLTLSAAMRLILSRVQAANLDRLEAGHRQNFFELILPKQEALAYAFTEIEGQQVRGIGVTSEQMVTRQGLHIFSLIRTYRLRNVVETGVCNGLSSYIILSALQQTNGRLLSIDLPEFSNQDGSDLVWEGKGGAVVPAGREVGWLVDESLKSNWDLQLGSSQTRQCVRQERL